MRSRPGLAAVAGLSMLLSSIMPAAPAGAAAPVRVILDGRVLALDPAPTIINGRTMVPLRGVFEAMGATVTWNGQNRTVEVARGDRYARLTLDRHLACLDRTCVTAASLDTTPTLVGDRTYIPLRFVASAMGVKVSWDEQRRAAVVETDKPPVPDVAPLTISGIAAGQVITAPTPLTVSGAAGSVQYYLLDPATGTGRMVAAGPDASAAYTFTPDPTNAGTRLLVAAVRDSAGTVRYSDPVQVLVAPDTNVQLTGVAYGDVITQPVTISAKLNFVATQVTYTLYDPATGTQEKIGTAGPGESVTLDPQVGQTGLRMLVATARDKAGKEYSSSLLFVTLQPAVRRYVSGIADGDVLTHGISIRTSGNYPIEGVQYLVDDRHYAWGYNLDWNLTPADNGPHTLRVKIYDKDGTITEMGPYHVTVNVKPGLWTSGVGPGQVVSGPITLKSWSNVTVTSVEYQLVDDAGNLLAVIGKGAPSAAVTFTPKAAGSYAIRTVGTTADGQTLTTPVIKFKAYFGKTYSPQPVVAKDAFLDLASRLAQPLYRETGLSAALQVAQAILETGWGQSAPVDKYTGQVSYNMFGIKGTGPAGSVISNTWEEYNGVAYRVDDSFRAYHSIEESWRDHADFLLLRSRYAPVQAVRTEPVLGAWALRQAGYATDSQYPLKLIDIMNRYDLWKLDEITF